MVLKHKKVQLIFSVLSVVRKAKKCKSDITKFSQKKLCKNYFTLYNPFNNFHFSYVGVLTIEGHHFNING